jgi:hypothetical protein
MLALRSATFAVVPALLGILALPAAAQRPAGGDSATITVSGTVYDSLSGGPLVGALVQLATSDADGGVLSALTDSAGHFQTSGVGSNQYIIGFTHPFLDSLGLDVPPMKLKVDGSTPLRLSLAIPAAHSILSQLCTTTLENDSSGLMLGFLRDADTGSRLDSGRVVLEWTEVHVSKDDKFIVPERRVVSAHATSAGWYALCGVPTAGTVATRAEVGSNSTGYIDVKVPPRGVLHRDFSIPIGTAAVSVVPPDSGGRTDNEQGRSDVAPIRRGRAGVTGIVRDRSGRPLHGARVLVWGSDTAASTDDDGRFSLAGLPAGTQTLEARYIGYAPKRVAVDLSSDRTASVTVTLDKIADVLSEVKVYGKQSALSKKLEGFRQRMRAGWGRFITRADIEKRAPIRFTDLLRGIPGIAIEPVGAFGYRIKNSRPGGCAPVVYVDGHRMVGPTRSDMDAINDIVWLDYVVGVEVYSSGIYAPPEYSGSRCGGSIVVWTSPDADVLDHAGGGGQ